MEHDAWFFVGVFAFIFLVWIATGGPLHPISFTGPKLAQPGVLGGGTYLQLPGSPFRIGSTEVHLSEGSGESIGSSGTNSPTPSFVGGTAFGETSVYRGIVSLSHSIQGAGSSDPRNEYFEISVSQNAGVPVDLSGWTIESAASGNAATLPQGAELPQSGMVNAGQDIILSPGERAIVASGYSPIGASFRENKCIGYYSTFQKFYPALPQTCPAPSDELTTKYGPDIVRDAKCIDYVNTLSRCQVILTPPTNVTGSCQSFLVKYLNYNGCVDAHRTDIDFSGKVWRIYLGRSSSMWRTQHEVVKLLDSKGKTVDAFNY